jgi:hypothetical protein
MDTECIGGPRMGNAIGRRNPNIATHVRERLLAPSTNKEFL